MIPGQLNALGTADSAGSNPLVFAFLVEHRFSSLLRFGSPHNARANRPSKREARVGPVERLVSGSFHGRSPIDRTRRGWSYELFS